MNLHKVMCGTLPNDTSSAAAVLLSLHSEYVTLSDKLDGILANGHGLLCGVIPVWRG
jgi:hypothetical protein